MSSGPGVVAGGDGAFGSVDKVRLPGLDAEGLWTGHLAMWLPTVGRFVDPTIYQANVAGRGEQMVMGVVLAPPSRAAIDGIGCEKNGSVITYWLVDDPAQSWRARLTPAVTRFADTWSRTLHRAVLAWLRNEPEGQQVAAEVTEKGVVDALVSAGVRR